MKLRPPGPLKTVVMAALFALAVPVCVAAVAPSVGFGLIALSLLVEQRSGGW